MIFYLCSYSDFFNNKDEDNSQKTLNDKNHLASSQKFRQLIFSIISLYPHFQILNNLNWNTLYIRKILVETRVGKVNTINFHPL